MGAVEDVLIFPEHCPNHGAKAGRYWIEPAGEGYELLLVVTVQYRCGPQGCTDSKSAATEPREARLRRPQNTQVRSPRESLLYSSA
jgi:hypothetical protein